MREHIRRISLILVGSLLAAVGAGLTAGSSDTSPAGSGPGSSASAATGGDPPPSASLTKSSSRHAARAVAAARFIIVSPQPGTPDASPHTQVSFLGTPATQLGTVTVVGSRSGHHTGKLKAYAAAPGASFVPSKAFSTGETVHVELQPPSGSLASPLSFSFTVARPGVQARLPAGRLPAIVKATSRPSSAVPVTEHFLSRPTLRPPRVVITKNDASPTPGDIFLAPLGSGGANVAQRGPMILDPQGHLVWFDPLPHHHGAEDFSAQMYNGAPALTFWEGHINPLGFGQGQDVILDRTYHVVYRVHGGNGEAPDLHEFVLSPQGTAWVDSYVPVRADLRSLGGFQDSSLLDSIVQEIDLKTGLVMFEWHPLGHIEPSESYAHVVNGQTWDPFHINSIDLHGDRMVVSGRNTWAVYEVSLVTGRILWRLGGKRSSFHLGPGARFAYQHDAHLRPDNTLTLFDDQAAPQVGSQSRGLMLKLDGRDASVAHTYTHPRRLIAGSQGNMQTLPNGDEVVGWGSEPYFSEFTSDGHLIMDGHFPRPVQSYRAFRFPWAGVPPTHPAFAASTGHGKVTAYASWNGATTVTSWQLLTGPDATHLRPAGTTARSGFETPIPVQTNQPYIAARALDAQGRELGTSVPIHP
ncbi:MAG TPA: arylsulfotransferase family protein [Solirubrobacteraceae bacterium]|jgi:hypothetical protein|nr:arylsulfotransferase family protein [Solirubrobacteraceae bacterium]